MILVVEHVPLAGSGLIRPLFERYGYAVRTVGLPDEDRFPRDFSGVDAVIILGGPMNAYEEGRYPFLRAEDAFIRKALREGIPMLGICLGAQLMAKAAGARVVKSSRSEIGWHTIRLTPEGRRDPVLSDTRETLPVFQWHDDRFEVPAGGVLLAESPVCPQAFKLGANAYGFQFHIEITPEMVGEWLEDYVRDPGREGPVDVAGIRAETARRGAEYTGQARRILENFGRIVRGGSVKRDGPDPVAAPLCRRSRFATMCFPPSADASQPAARAHDEHQPSFHAVHVSRLRAPGHRSAQKPSGELAARRPRQDDRP